LRIYKFEIQNMLLILSNARFVWAANAFLEQVVGIIFTVIAFNKVSLVNARIVMKKLILVLFIVKNVIEK